MYSIKVAEDQAQIEEIIAIRRICPREEEGKIGAAVRIGARCSDLADSLK